MLAYTLADVVANKLGGTLGDLEAKAVLDMLTNALKEVKAATLGDTLGDVEAHALVDMLTDTLPLAKSETLGEILSDVYGRGTGNDCGLHSGIDEDPGIWRHSGRRKDRSINGHASRLASTVGG